MVKMNPEVTAIPDIGYWVNEGGRCMKNGFMLYWELRGTPMCFIRKILQWIDTGVTQLIINIPRVVTIMTQCHLINSLYFFR